MEFCHALICYRHIQVVAKNARTLSLIPMLDFSLMNFPPPKMLGSPIFLLPTFFVQRNSSRKKRKHTQEMAAGLIFWDYFLVPLEIPMISKIPGWVSLPINDLQSTLSLPTRQIARNASAVRGCLFRKTSSFSGNAVFLDTAGWSPSNGG